MILNMIEVFHSVNGMTTRINRREATGFNARVDHIIPRRNVVFQTPIQTMMRLKTVPNAGLQRRPTVR